MVSWEGGPIGVGLGVFSAHHDSSISLELYHLESQITKFISQYTSRTRPNEIGEVEVDPELEQSALKMLFEKEEPTVERVKEFLG